MGRTLCSADSKRGIFDLKLHETPIKDAWLIELEPIVDERGFFARSLCVEKLAGHGLEGRMVQQSMSYNQRCGTLRGMHYQRAPHNEIKLVRVTQGLIYDVILDLRRESPSYLKWHALELSAENRRTLYIPGGVAHGFQTLADRSEVFYQMAQPYASSHSSGVRWDDSAFGIEWPIAQPILSERDASYPNYAA
jgi:dTDP-4-dehydrorhamnose 3,5-epimerase